MKRVLLSLVTIAGVAALAFGASQAFFSDTETSVGNTITAGTIDISVDQNNPWSAPVTISDMKPSYVRWTKHVVRNVGNNPLKLWKHIKNVTTGNNEWSEPECTSAGGTWIPPITGQLFGGCTNGQEQNNIDEYIVYDMYIDGNVSGIESSNWLGGQHSGGTVVIDEDDGITLDDIESVFVYLGEVAPNDEITVWQSYHMKDETGNWAQTDQVSFTIEFYAEQVNGNGPTSTSLLLENKVEGPWTPILGDGMWGILKWAGDGSTFNFSSTFEGHGLQPSTAYALIYAPDPWPQGPLPGGPSTVLGTGGSNPLGELTISDNPNLGYDIPHPTGDTNFPTGGKIWLVLDADHDGIKMNGWNPTKYLFEYNLIKYDDTDI